ncbi:NADH-quinone oxidoreductase subunit A [Wolbachia endosymbiont of Howardula sp.]|uniref:NADH-quinone oxidoreductase subunit A n=1 Tax=Wolbachia endosymbiont of Howardula sp. TaxID=2916816 RepID=UPI00217E7A39|nr:NADH-quinone oxidoreductase subunit A [Wolbachia endosymbiont of Howardula sp.]UWI83311.1 NADH-quinone oxidoreductase subunit A [Wolbachia endosymbiont of Howardula sp.]
MTEYLAIIIYICIAIIISVTLCVLPILLVRNKPSFDKQSTYECGFNTLSSARKNFDIKFYLVSILFIIFDIEIIFLFPWAISLSKIHYTGFWSMIVFLAILTIGFIYEWCKGALTW